MDAKETDPRWLPRLAWAAVGGVFVVNLMGFLDTYTGSALGCGRDWPLCDGQVIPGRWTLQRLVEFGHRGLVTIAVTLVVFVGISALRSPISRRMARPWVISGFFFVGLQAVFGALAVVSVNPPWVLAFHFGCSLLALASFLLLALTVQAKPQEVSGQRRDDLAGLRRRTWIFLGTTFAAVYYSAYVAFLGDGLACQGWPLCQGRWLPASPAAAWDFGHRLAALILTGLAVALWREATRVRRCYPAIYADTVAVVGLTGLQSLSGAYVALSHASLPSFMTHVALMMGLFSAVCHLAWKVRSGWLDHGARGREVDVDRPMGG